MFLTWQHPAVPPAPSGDPYWNNVSFLLEVTATGAKNKKTGSAFTLMNGATTSTANATGGNTHSIYLPPQGSGVAPYAYMADDANMVFGTSDFTIEWMWRLQSIPNQSGAMLAPLFYWGTWAAGTNAANMEVVHNATANLTAMTINAHGTSWSSPTTVMPINQLVTCAIVRKAGMISHYINGTRMGSPMSLSTSFNHTATQPFVLGRRAGGNNDIFWYLNGYISALRMTKVARYDGTSYVPPTVFPAF